MTDLAAHAVMTRHAAALKRLDAAYLDLEAAAIGGNAALIEAVKEVVRDATQDLIEAKLNQADLARAQAGIGPQKGPQP